MITLNSAGSARQIQHLVADEQQLFKSGPLHAKQKVLSPLVRHGKTRASTSVRLLYRLGTRLRKLGHDILLKTCGFPEIQPVRSDIELHQAG